MNQFLCDGWSYLIYSKGRTLHIHQTAVDDVLAEFVQLFELRSDYVGTA